MRVCIGIDVAKEIHWATAVNEDGRVLLDRRVENTAEDIQALIDGLRALGGERVVGLDLLGGLAAFLSALLIAAGERLVHVPGLTVNRARQGRPGGQAKSDPRDARVIADQLRLHDHFRPIEPADQTVAELRLLVSRRDDLVVDQTRRITRLRNLLLTIHPGLERALDVGAKGSLWLLTRYAAAGDIRKAGRKRLLRHLGRTAHIHDPEALADKALAAANAQPADLQLPGERMTAELIAELAAEALATRTRIRDIDRRLADLLTRHPDGTLIQSLPGMGVVLAAEFLAQAGPMGRFASPDALASAAGLAPVLRQSGKSSHLRRTTYADKNLKRVFYQSAFCSLGAPESRAFYDRKRREGKRHHQALIALARRRINVLWAMMRDRQPYRAQNQPSAA
ncbi:IS110 family transposase [Azospirillum melinis]|uniref:IS110 family transposase n=1 Tax=Azospirillum melinis TaxID=328839 RepID=UPI0037574F48